MTKPEAVKAAEKLRNLTSDDEDAFFYASLLHDLGEQRRALRADLLSNAGWEESRAFGFRVQTPAGPKVAYVYDDDGEAEDPEGQKCKSYGQRIAELTNSIADIEAVIEREHLPRQVEKALPEVQKAALEKAKARAAQPDDPARA